MRTRRFARLTHQPCCELTLDYSLQAPKAHGTSATPVQEKLRWNCDRKLADGVCNFNRHYAENSGYFEKITEYMAQTKTQQPIEYYDSNTGKLLFTAPKGRTMEEFLVESKAHGWYVVGVWMNRCVPSAFSSLTMVPPCLDRPSFRDDEVNWDYVRVLPDGETVSVDGTHLGTCLVMRWECDCFDECES